MFSIENLEFRISDCGVEFRISDFGFRIAELNSGLRISTSDCGLRVADLIWTCATHSCRVLLVFEKGALDQTKSEIRNPQSEIQLRNPQSNSTIAIQSRNQ
jgi:hypothetical protein